MSMISSKRQFGHVETINFRALKNRGMKLPEMTFQAFKGATGNTRVLVFYRYYGENNLTRPWFYRWEIFYYACAIWFSLLSFGKQFYNQSESYSKNYRFDLVSAWCTSHFRLKEISVSLFNVKLCFVFVVVFVFVFVFFSFVFAAVFGN